MPFIIKEVQTDLVMSQKCPLYNEHVMNTGHFMSSIMKIWPKGAIERHIYLIITADGTFPIQSIALRGHMQRKKHETNVYINAISRYILANKELH